MWNEHEEWGVCEYMSSMSLDTWGKSILSCREYYQQNISHVQRKVEKFHLLTAWSGFCKPLQIFPHQLFPLTKLISIYKTFISLQTLVRQNWYLILRQRYIWYCIVLHRLHTNNTSKNHSNVEWSKTIQNLAISWVNLFLEFHHSESFPSIFKALPSGLSCFHCTIQSFYFLF